MKNKRGKFIFDTIAIILVIIIVLNVVLIIILTAIGLYDNKPEFKITEEDCFNESLSDLLVCKNSGKLPNANIILTIYTTNYYNLSSFEKSGGLESLDLPIDKSENLITFSYSDLVNIGCPDFIICDSCYKIKEKEICEQVEVMDLKIHQTEPYEAHFNLSILKEDLTIEWLDKNCLCLSLCDYELYKKPLCFKTLEDALEDWKNLDNLKCSEYKCGEYNVEVLK